MGKIGGFLESKRRDPGYRSRAERQTDNNAVERRFSDNEVQIQASRCMGCGTPTCHTGCPLGNLIPEFNDLAYRGLWEEASKVLLHTASFPEFTGRLCPAPCEPACVLEGTSDTAVSIRQIELAIIEKAFEQGYIRPTPPPSRNSKRVAVIGSGPAGLAVADYLNRAGFSITVYDSADKPGGLLRYGIPDFKLEKWVLDRRLNMMKEEGIVFETGVIVGIDISLKFLNQRYDAVALCCGSQTPRDLDIPGRDLKGVSFAMPFLVRQNKKVAGETHDTSLYLDAKSKRVVVIGGGDTGSDCIGTAARQRAEQIYQLEILPKPPSTRPNSTPWPAWPNVLRTSSSHEEADCVRLFGVATKEFIGKGGILSGVKIADVEWEKKPNGTYIPVDKPGSERELKCELALLAVGFSGPIISPIFDRFNLALNKRGNVYVDENHMTSTAGIFAAGDMALGQSLIVSALADARKTAVGIIRYLENPPS